ncbi:hypothetical protein NLJ89_g11627 [Agrocybe chaxingu]|uniref:Uncharacterized protein n=1 Tax=Agrocybe chaxingu TaxID=84603 RepID=A0A9W8JND7_9AGAR|nr:hypothetical protein NLJ89_g11627 [Agrocybe chaxingu]
MIDHDFVTGYPLDNLIQLGEMLIKEREQVGDTELVMWKSDIAEAYRACPMHPCWQIKQAIRVGDEYYIDRANVFGGSGSGAIFIAVNSLVAWVAKYECGISNLMTYVDDSSGIDLKGDELYYEPYHKSLPRHQAILLELWDNLGIPHKERKQIAGSPIPVIGISVDPNLMSFTLPEDSLRHLLEELQEWCKKGARFKLKQWQQMAGWFNWGLNVYPLLRPALNNLYPKIQGKQAPNEKIWVNKAIKEDFEWAKKKMECSTGVLLLRSLSWDINNALHTILCDACPEGMGFWYPNLLLAFYARTPSATLTSLISFYEALCVLSALREAHYRSPLKSRFVIYTDNFNAVSIFNSLQALPDYNCIIKAAVDILSNGDHDLRVLHIPGEQNQVADALSHCRFLHALHLVPQLSISMFQPYIRIARLNQPCILQPP